MTELVFGKSSQVYFTQPDDEGRLQLTFAWSFD